MSKREYSHLVFAACGIALVVFIALPLLNLFASAELGEIIAALEDPAAMNTIKLSLLAGFYAAVLVCAFGVPLAYLLARCKFPCKWLLEGVLDLPVVVPHTVAGLALLLLFCERGMLGSELAKFNVHFVDTLWGVVAAMVFVSAPFFINCVRQGIELVDERLEKVAQSLGASRLRAFFTVTLPLVWANVLEGAVLCWARAISELGAVIMVAYYPMVAATYIYVALGTPGKGVAAAQAVSVVLLLICLAVFVAMRVLAALVRRYVGA
jgi:molybdate/tungstate transport system permease protein